MYTVFAVKASPNIGVYCVYTVDAMTDDKNSPEEERPTPRDKVVTSRVPEDVFRDAEKKARKQRRSLSAIIRSFLTVWAADEYPDPPPMPDENIRAAKRKKKKK